MGWEASGILYPIQSSLLHPRLLALATQPSARTPFQTPSCALLISAISPRCPSPGAPSGQVKAAWCISSQHN